MRIAIGTVICLSTAFPAGASEAFIAQLTGRAVAAELSAKATLSSAMLALPLQPKAINGPAVSAANAATNASVVMQIGANNLAAVSQAGGGNASSLVQRGNGNQATVTQRR
jgi:hypothetical protein